MLFPRGKTGSFAPMARSAPHLDMALFCSGWATSPTPHSKAVAWVSSFASQDATSWERRMFDQRPAPRDVSDSSEGSAP